jgi:hypothetical protein
MTAIYPDRREPLPVAAARLPTRPGPGGLFPLAAAAQATLD